MASKKQRENKAKAKAKKQKIVAAVGAVLLVGLLAFQVPRTMKMLNASAAPPPPPPATTTPTGVPTDPSVLPTPGTVGEGAAPAASGGGTLVDSDARPTASSGQLVVFGRFSSKDPFTQQIDPNAGGGGGGGADGTAGEPAEPSEPAAEPDSGSGGGAVSPSSGASPSVAKGSALLSINGTEEVVARGADFPANEPVFKLVSLTRTTVRIAVAGGAFASGSPTVTLERGKATTLVNTADGTRYELELVASGG
jgi:hypothetical protein